MSSDNMCSVARVSCWRGSVVSVVGIMMVYTRRCLPTVCFLALVVLAGCGESNTDFIARIAKYRVPLDGERIAKGIPIVPPHWIPRSDRSAAAWDNPEFTHIRKAAVHQYKFLTFSDQFADKGTLLSETDHYENGKIWLDPAEGTQVEFIRITYSYEREHAGQNPWMVRVCRQETGIIPQDTSLEKATAILLEWGIDRLEHNLKQANRGDP